MQVRDVRLAAGSPDQTVVILLNIAFDAVPADGVRFDAENACLQMDVDASPFQGTLCLLSVESPRAGKDLIALIHEMNLCCSFKQVHQLASQFHACGPGSDDHNGARAGWSQTKLPQAFLKWGKVAEGVESQSVIANTRDPEVIRDCSGGQDELAVDQMVPPRCGDAVILNID